jgi:hypothetical protein
VYDGRVQKDATVCWQTREAASSFETRAKLAPQDEALYGFRKIASRSAETTPQKSLIGIDFRGEGIRNYAPIERISY